MNLLLYVNKCISNNFVLKEFQFKVLFSYICEIDLFVKKTQTGMYISNNDEYGDWCLSSLSANVKEERQVEDTKGVIRSRKSKVRIDNTKTNKDKGTNNGLQNNTEKTQDRATGTSVKTVGELRCTERIISSCCTFGTRLDR